MRELYPEIAHVKKYSLKVSDLHTLYEIGRAHV